MTTPRKVYQLIASALQARINCEHTGNAEWHTKHTETINTLVETLLPRGAGFDNGTKFDFDKSKPNRLVFNTSFHHMDTYGSYDGWTDHSVIITPDLACDFDIRVTGWNRNDIKDYIVEAFHAQLSNTTTD